MTIEVGTKVKWLDIIGGKIACLVGEVTGNEWDGIVPTKGKEITTGTQYTSYVPVKRLRVIQDDNSKQP